MKKAFLLFSLLLLLSCQNFGKLQLKSTLSKNLEEVSGTEVVPNSDLIWMINDSGNKPKIYGLSKDGDIKKDISVKANNNDWEDLTSDEKGNLYIGDFGNNESKRKNLVILKIKNKDLLGSKKIEVEKIKFYYPNQTKYPPKKKNLYFDSEAFFYFKKSLYIFTKSRVKNKFGLTSLYKIPAKKGNHKAVLIAEFNNGENMENWITSADISKDEKKIALLTPSAVLIFSDYRKDNFFSGELKRIKLNYSSQKEGLTFKNKNTLLITDEKAHGAGGNFYELKI